MSEYQELEKNLAEIQNKIKRAKRAAGSRPNGAGGINVPVDTYDLVQERIGIKKAMKDLDEEFERERLRQMNRPMPLMTTVDGVLKRDKKNWDPVTQTWKGGKRKSRKPKKSRKSRKSRKPRKSRKRR